MNQQIKERIYQIKNGEVPHGYKKTKIGIVPNEWEVCRAKEIFKNVSDKNHNGDLEVLSVTQDRGVIPRSNIDIDIKYDLSNVINYKKVNNGDFVISLRSFQGGIEYSDYTGLVSPAYTVLKNIRDIIPIYYKMYFKSDDYIKHLNVAVYGIRDGKQISYDDFGFIEIPYPPLNEQQKIADILSTQDKVIELKEKLLKEKERQKKYLIQTLLTGKKRLKGFNGEWKKVKLGVCITEVVDKTNINNQYPVLTSSRKGIFLQNQYFNKSISSDDNIGYKILRKNEFTYRTMSDDGKYTFNLLEEYEIGMVSPAYSVFNVNSNVCESKFLYYLLNDFSFNKYIIKLIQGGTRLALRYSELCKLEIKFPPLEEQKAIAEILTTADREIKLLKDGLEEEKRKKKSLMQLLLTGIVRVNS